MRDYTENSLYAAYANICPLTQDADGNTTCMAHPYFSPDAPQAGLPPAERTTPVYTFSAPESPPVCSGRDEEVWLELSATWWGKRTTPENQAQSGKSGGVEIAHPKGILTSLKPDGASHLEQRLHWRLVTPPNRPDLLETLPATMASGPFTRLIPHARLNIREPGVYEVELSVVGDDGDRLMLDTMQVQVMGVDLDAHWPGTMAEPGPLVSDAEERDSLNLIASVNDDDDNDDSIIDNDRTQSPAIVPEDDEVMTVIVRALAVNPGVGTLELFAGDGLHFFTADGTQELSLPLSVDLAHPSGPLADAVNAEHPRDVTLLVEANIPVERTMVELIYSQAVKEIARYDVHCSVVDLTIQGGYTRGSVRYSAAMNLKGTWVVFRDFDAERPITVLIPEPSHEAGVYRSVWYRKSTDPEQEWKKDGWLLDGSYFFNLVEQWNALLDFFHIPFGHYEKDDVLRWMSQATGISQYSLQSSRYLVTGLIDEPGEYDIKLLDTEQNEEHAKEITVHVSRPGQMRGQFRIIGDEEAPYVHEAPLEEIAENDEQFFRTLGGMRLHLLAEFTPLLTQYASEIVGFDWYSTQEIEFHFSEASFAKGQPNNLRADLVSQGVPEAVIIGLQEVLENKSFCNLDALLDVIPPAFEGYTINDRALNELNKYVEEGLFPDYFENSKNKQNPRDGLRALRWEKKDGELMEVKERSYANAESLAEALRTTKNVDDASRYAVAGYRVSRQVLARSRATHDSSSASLRIKKPENPVDIYLKIEVPSHGAEARVGPGWSYRITKTASFRISKCVA